MSRNIDACWAIAAAAVQIGLAIREAELEVGQLTACIERMAQRLRLQRERSANADGPAAAVGDNVDAELEQGLMGAIVHMQFYDRLAQHLAHIEQFMTGAARQLTSGSDGDEHAWQELCEDLRARLTSQTHQGWLDALWTRGDRAANDAAQPSGDYDAPGAVEFFFQADECD
jgi:hypothetical protein